ncbi:hypothetical protein ACIA74_29175 [Streptomyces sp. NPDC051658]|uniref:hypothetical protein n=1 Tax=unclassified Streptomyces TaxID=2593676 RepID=UPI003798FC23|nr:hypothetical protein OG520_04925 [Streptomyces sp. NBC_00984]
MASLSGPGLFDSIEREFTSREPASGLLLEDGSITAAVPLSPAEARPILYDRSADPAVRTSLWRQAVALAQADADRSGWPLCAVWLAVPGLRRTAFRIADRFGTAREDVEAELATACLEALREMGPDTADPGSVLLRSACTRAWNAARRARSETAVENIDAVAGARQGTDGHWQVEFERAERPAGLCAPLRITVPADRAEGVRVGALAQEWGLADTVGDTRRLRRGRRVGTLSLRGPGRRG